jgi:DUF4097 and DUF4098 domain-containing protein YvlB
MPTFNTPQPISVTVELGVGDVRIVASDRTDTEVLVRPSDPANKSDVTAAEGARVEYSDGRLLIKGPKGRRQYSFRGRGYSIAVQINLPAGSEVRGDAGIVAFSSTGRLGECHFRTGIGELQVDDAGGSVGLKTGRGDITVGRASGHVDVMTGSGAVRIASIKGTAVVKNSNGDTWIGEVVGDLRANAANGKIVVDQAHATVAARTANGDVRLREVGGGAIVAQTAFGAIDIGVLDGVAAWLDLATGFGKVRSDLDAVERPRSGEPAVEVRARTSFGDVTVCHASPDRTGEEVA